MGRKGSVSDRPGIRQRLRFPIPGCSNYLLKRGVFRVPTQHLRRFGGVGDETGRVTGSSVDLLDRYRSSTDPLDCARDLPDRMTATGTKIERSA
jgi:hypothetical protein